MARGVYSSSNHFRLATGVITSMPLTMACWINPSAFTATRFVLGLTSSNAAPDGWGLRINQTTGVLNAVSYAAGANSSAAGASACSAGVWNHIAGVYPSATSRFAYANGAVGSENATSRTPASAIDKTSIGCLVYSSNTIYQSATEDTLAEVGFWNVALTAADMLQLAAGYSPLFVKPESLVAYYPLIRGDASGDEPDLIGGAKMVEQGTVAVQNHAPVRYFNARARWLSAGTINYSILVQDCWHSNYSDGPVVPGNVDPSENAPYYRNIPGRRV